MKRNSYIFPLIILLITISLSGCADTSLRTGISPVLDVASVQSAAANQATIVEALAADAGLAPGDPEYYYRAAEAGFNFVDDQCSAYFDYMFFFDRRRNELKSGLATAGATTGAILGLTNASTMSSCDCCVGFRICVERYRHRRRHVCVRSPVGDEDAC